MDLQVLYEDNHIIAVNKKVGELVQGDRSGDPCLIDALKRYLKETYHKPGNVFLGVVHRLDRPTSGVVLFARTSKALQRLNTQFRENRVHKLYWAMVKVAPPKPSDTLIHYLRRNTTQNKSYAEDNPVEGHKEARMSYRWVLSLDRYHLLEVELHTGRHHQIRAQLAKIGCPVKGDLKYGFPRSNPDGGIHLHARAVCLDHPVRKIPLQITADPPADPIWDAVLQRLAESNISVAEQLPDLRQPDASGMSVPRTIVGSPTVRRFGLAPGEKG
ncbi:MAG: RluA family pseudouridine synthase [Spirochaetaceae bacterium]|nr:MAG: RluA family pseudouridine synthase [Spirochaetaceae bacterium]